MQDVCVCSYDVIVNVIDGVPLESASQSLGYIRNTRSDCTKMVDWALYCVQFPPTLLEMATVAKLDCMLHKEINAVILRFGLRIYLICFV